MKKIVSLLWHLKTYTCGTQLNTLNQLLSINLRRSRDGTRMLGWVFVWGGVFGCIRSSLHSVRFGYLLSCTHKRIVNIMKVYIKRKNMQVELIRFRKKYRIYSR